MPTKQKPSWWLCYLIWALMTGLLAWNYWTPGGYPWQNLMGAAISVCGFGLLCWWLRANHDALQREDEDKEAWRRDPRRDMRLSPVQARYLKVMDGYRKR